MALLNIRNATVNDASAIAAIQVDAWRAAYATIIPQKHFDGLTVEKRSVVWRELITAKCGSEQVIIGEVDAQICAYAHYGRSRDPSAGQTTGELCSLYVAPNHWRRGFGQQLLAASIRELAGAGFGRATLWVLAQNKPARQFYGRFGWETDGAEKGNEERKEIRYRIDLSAHL